MRTVILGDAKDYILENIKGASVITSLPDMEEVGLDVNQWAVWFVKMTEMVLRALDDSQYAIFYQTDRKFDGYSIDKSYLINKAAQNVGVGQMWHKIVACENEGTVNLFRPTYTHLLCFSKNGKPQKATPDILKKGDMVYKNAMGLNACLFACNFVKTVTDTVFDPFCGKGSVLAIANSIGLKAIGVDILPEQVEDAKNLTINSTLI